MKRWEGCLRFHLQKKFHYKTYFPLPEERITRISFCKNLPESQFLCYRKVITNVDIASRQKRGFARRKEDTVSRTALLLFLTSEIQPYCIALWKSLAMPQVPPHQSIWPLNHSYSNLPWPFANTVKGLHAQLSESEGKEREGKGHEAGHREGQ